MMGFIISTLAVGFTAWIVYAATRRAAYLDGIMDANQQWRRELEAVRSNDPCIKYMVARFSAGRVPAGTSQLPQSRINIPMPPVQPPRYCYGCDCDGSASRVAACHAETHPTMCSCQECLGYHG